MHKTVKGSAMKPWFSKDADLLFLHNSIQKYMRSSVESQKKPLAVSSKQPPDEASQSLAAKKIQHLWRGYKVKETFVKDPYGAYLSMIDPDDEQRLLSSIMFGRHEAELHKGTKDRATNPYIHPQAAYHRCDNLTGSVLLTQLQQEFEITPDMLRGMSMIPVTDLKTVSIDVILKQYQVKGCTILRKPNTSIAIILAPNPSQESYLPLRNLLVSAGLIASPWEIAQQISVAEKETTTPVNALPKMASLPKTKEELLASNLFRRLNQVAQNRTRPTHRLASSIVQL